ncbi:hypothetical protein ACWC5I_13805 [Kitasatospora sp. NPDC001574]
MRSEGGEDPGFLPDPEGLDEEGAWSESAEDVPRPASGRVGPLSCLAFVVAVVALVAGGVVWVLQDQLVHPFGDTRACKGSDTMLPPVISAGGTALPADASDIHYFTRAGVARVSFLSDRMPDHLRRAGFVTKGTSLFDRSDAGSSYGLGPDERELPEGLCGPALRGPAWRYGRPGPGAAVTFTVEGSPVDGNAFRAPARVVASFGVG